MILCHCKAITDRDVRAVHDAGGRSIVEVARACGAARECGGCRPSLAALLDQLAAAPSEVGDRLRISA
jgi:bacterioferritin-associated ferredoxin